MQGLTRRTQTPCLSGNSLARWPEGQRRAKQPPRLLSQEMEADVVSVLHICPMANREFREPRYVTSAGLKQEFPGKGTLEIWKELMPDAKFLSISVEELLDTIRRQVRSFDPDWVSYLEYRYGW